MVWDTKTTLVYEEHYLKNHHHEVDVLKWAATQPALPDPEVTTLVNVPEVAHLRQTDRVENPIAAVQRLVEIVDQIVERAPTSDDSHEDRELAIESGDAIDLPSGSVRAIYARLLNFKRKRRKPNLRAAKRIIRQIRCGAQVEKHDVDDLTGELTPTCRDTFICKTPGCVRPLCHAQNTQHKKAAFNRDLKRLKEQNPGYRLIMATLKTPWPLPKAERRHLPGHPTLAVLGRGKPTLIRPGPMTKAAETNLLQLRLKEHEKARTKFTKNNVVRELCAQHTHYTTEFGFLTPSTEGHR